MPPDTLTRERIVAAAIELLDQVGLEGLSMRALGERLDSAATAVYWHVRGKGELVALAGDHVWAEIELPAQDAATWKVAARAMATRLHEALLRHPWLVGAFGSFPVYGPGKARFDDHTIALFESAGFAGTRADQAAATVFVFVLGSALGPATAARRRGKKGNAVEKRLRDTSVKARTIAAQFPRLRARIGSRAAEYAAPPDRTFEFGLDAILDGLEVQLRTARHR